IMPSTPGILSASAASIFFTRACGIGLTRILQNTMPSARKSSAYFAAPVTLASRSGGVKFFPTSLYAMSRLPGGMHHRLQIMVIGAAAAQVAGHRVARLLDRGFRIGMQQSARRHDLARRAEAALR